LTEGLYAELRGTPVAVTVVFPGVIATNILGNSVVSTPGGIGESHGIRGKQTSPASAGKQIVEAVEKGSYRVRIGRDALLLDRLSRLMPQRTTVLIANQIKSTLHA
jgi:short-subunit dehydrogenase